MFGAWEGNWSSFLIFNFGGGLFVCTWYFHFFFFFGGGQGKDKAICNLKSGFC